MFDVSYKAGTQKAPQQTKITLPCFTDTDHVHFPDGVLSTLPPYAVAGFTSDAVELKGAVRKIHAQMNIGGNDGLFTLLGSNTRLYAVKNSIYHNITPFADQKAESLGNNPLACHSGQPALTVTWPAHGLSVGDAVSFTGAMTIDGFTPAMLNVEHTVASTPTSNTFTITMGSNASSTVAAGGGASITASSIGVAATLGANPISVTDTSKTVTITYTAHGLAVGDRIKLRDATATGGITAAVLNVEHIVTATPTADTFRIEASSAATSTTTGGGSVIRLYKQMAKGIAAQSSATGFGIDIYGSGIFGVDGDAGAAQAYPRIWSIAQFSLDVVLNAGDYLAGDGQKIYLWDGNLDKAPTVLPNAPTNCSYVQVVNNAVVALCERQIRICELGDATVWTGRTTYTSREQSVWRFIAAAEHNDKNALIWSPNKTFLLSYTGDSIGLWDLRELMNDAGLISPNSFCTKSGVLFWRAAKTAYMFDGSPPKRIANDQNEDWINGQLNYGAAWHCFAYADPLNEQWYWHFASIDEPDNYVIHSLKDGSHTLGMMQRTAAQQNPMTNASFIMADIASESVAGETYRHFTNGAVTFNWYAETSLAYVSKGDVRGSVDRILPDSSMTGSATLQVISQEYPQGAATLSTSYTFDQSTKYIAPKAAGKLVGLRFSGNRAFTIGGWLMNVVNRGRR